MGRSTKVREKVCGKSFEEDSAGETRQPFTRCSVLFKKRKKGRSFCPSQLKEFNKPLKQAELHKHLEKGDLRHARTLASAMLTVNAQILVWMQIASDEKVMTEIKINFDKVID